MSPLAPRWRVGSKLGRTLYLDNVCVGMVDTPELAAEIVAAMNRCDPDQQDVEEALLAGIPPLGKEKASFVFVEASNAISHPVLAIPCPNKGCRAPAGRTCDRGFKGQICAVRLKAAREKPFDQTLSEAEAALERVRRGQIPRERLVTEGPRSYTETEPGS